MLQKPSKKLCYHKKESVATTRRRHRPISRLHHQLHCTTKTFQHQVLSAATCSHLPPLTAAVATALSPEKSCDSRRKNCGRQKSFVSLSGIISIATETPPQRNRYQLTCCHQKLYILKRFSCFDFF